MCGIVGYVGPRQATDFLIGGLRRLEYRGYDSSGVAVAHPSGRLVTTKTAGRIVQLETPLADAPAPGRVGIGHTRWATHGAATDTNAHPHLGGDGELAVVHNGVIENFQALKQRLTSEGHVFRSSTDSEVIAVVGEGDTAAADLADDVIEVPQSEDFLQPIISIIPLQLLAYHIAAARGCDVDKPRNLAKSVTVE